MTKRKAELIGYKKENGKQLEGMPLDREYKSGEEGEMEAMMRYIESGDIVMVETELEMGATQKEIEEVKRKIYEKGVDIIVMNKK